MKIMIWPVVFHLSFNVTAALVEDRAHFFSAIAVSNAKQSLQTLEKKTGIEINIKTLNIEGAKIKQLRPTAKQLNLTIIRSPFKEQIEIGEGLEAKSFPPKQVKRLRRILRQNFSQGYYDHALYSSLRFFANTLLE